MSATSIKRRLFDGAKKKPCFYCKNNLTFDDATIDHKVPRSKGGETSLENSVISCRKCNNKKGSTSFEDFLKTRKWHQRQKRSEDFKSRKRG